MIWRMRCKNSQRRNNIKNRGLKEAAAREDLLAYFTELFSGWARLECEIIIGISVAHCVGLYKVSQKYP